jgi:hypothetical protein
MSLPTVKNLTGEVIYKFVLRATLFSPRTPHPHAMRDHKRAQYKRHPKLILADQQDGPYKIS